MSACMSMEGQNGKHIPIERMRQVIIDCSGEFTSLEQEHVESCNSCLHLFGQMMMSSWDEYTLGS